VFLHLSDEKGFVEVSGNTLLVYFFLLKKRQTCGVREIQRALGFSSSSSAYYHLEKLVQRGVLIKDLHGNYRINEEMKVRLFDRFFVVHGFVFPKQLLYAVVTTIMCLSFVLLLRNSLTLTVVLALLPGFVASGIFWYDAAELWLSLPSFKGSVR
jgi:hypothetical protein